jgi:transcriptional regulator with XRE-family HTH domain
MKQITFDNKSFALAIDAARWAKHQSWKQVSDETGVSKATLCRIQQGKSPDVNTLARLLSWCGMDFKRFISMQAEGVA